jgi:ribosome biogenesis GTPase
MTAMHHPSRAHSRDVSPLDPTESRPTAPDGPVARVVAQHRGRWLLLPEPIEADREPRPATLAGRLARDPAADARPVVGDRVRLDAGSSDGPARIVEVLPRHSLLRRGAPDGSARHQPLAANVDVALVVVPADRPVNPRRLEREVTLVWESGATPVVVLTKRDLCPDPDAAIAQARAAAPGVAVLAISVRDAIGLDRLQRWLSPGATVALIGASGAGKSTLVNHLLGDVRLRTGTVRGDGAGRHATTHRELVALRGGAFLIDTPGLRALALWSEPLTEHATALDHTFADVATLAAGCRFPDCRHRTEPACAVREALAAGRLSVDRLAAWESLERELAHLERRRTAAARAEGKAAERRGTRALRTRVEEKWGADRSGA